MSDVPAARAELEDIRAWLSNRGHPDVAERVGKVIGMLKREPFVRRAPSRSRPLTKTLAAAIRVWAEDHEDWTMQQIAERFEVNIGRVSEALAERHTSGT